jgi:hypothetical protein
VLLQKQVKFICCHIEIQTNVKEKKIVIDNQYIRQYRFESDMPLEQHRHFNKILNDTVNRSQAREYKVNYINQVATLVIIMLNRENVSNISIQLKQIIFMRFLIQEINIE